MINDLFIYFAKKMHGSLYLIKLLVYNIKTVFETGGLDFVNK
jgi:hypothetical protein